MMTPKYYFSFRSEIFKDYLLKIDYYEFLSVSVSRKKLVRKTFARKSGLGRLPSYNYMKIIIIMII